MQEDYEKRGWSSHHQQRLEFLKPKDRSPRAVTLHITKQSSTHEKWVIQPLNPPKVKCLSLYKLYTTLYKWFFCTWLLQILKRDVDHMKKKSEPPYCRLAIKWRGDCVHTFPDVSFQVDLEGTKDPYHYFNVELPETGEIDIYC